MVMLSDAQPPTWTLKDRLLAMALVAYESTLCRDCGQPIRESYDVRMTGYYEVRDDITCMSCEAVEQWQERQKNHRQQPGVKPYVVNTLTWGEQP